MLFNENLNRLVKTIYKQFSGVHSTPKESNQDYDERPATIQPFQSFATQQQKTRAKQNPNSP
jgi:hypothetical protein